MPQSGVEVWLGSGSGAGVRNCEVNPSYIIGEMVSCCRAAVKEIAINLFYSLLRAEHEQTRAAYLICGALAAHCAGCYRQLRALPS